MTGWITTRMPGIRVNYRLPGRQGGETFSFFCSQAEQKKENSSLPGVRESHTFDLPNIT